MTNRLRFFVVLCLLLVSLPLMSFALSAQDAEFESSECAFEVSGTFDVECGYVTVPESRDPALADDTNTIRLAVAVFRSTSSDPQPDPLIYLDGGPGGYTLALAEGYMSQFAPFLEQRDVILFDQRGVGASEPNLDCPELTELSYELLDEDVPVAEAIEQANEVELECRARLVEEGANIGAYNTLENAADVAAIAEALGYEQVNLFGISYGTRLALVTMREYPDLLRSVVIDAVYPPEVNAYAELTVNAERAFNELFEGCAEDAACNAEYPNLDEVFYETVARLNETPELVTYFDPYTGEDRDILLNGEALVSTLFSLLYDSAAIPGLPEAIYAASEGSYDVFLDDILFSTFFSTYFSESQYNSFECYEEVPFTTLEQINEAAADVNPAVRDVYVPLLEGLLTLCAEWSETAAPGIEAEPIVSDIPTLVTVGEYDPITPPAWAELTAASLSNSYYYEFPGVGHSAFFGGACPQQIIVDFIENPNEEPDAVCIADIGPQFVAAPLGELELVEVENETLGFAGLVPDGWNEVADGVFSPNANGDVPVMAYRFPESLDAYVEQIFVTNYGLDGLPESQAQIEAGDFTWDIYEAEQTAQGAFSVFAITTADDGSVYVIAVVGGSEEDRDTLYETVMLPALEAFRLLP
jgi:pimeloyl-ACP methyl ester carboxylesterase